MQKPNPDVETHADARRLRRIDPAGESREPLGDHQRIVVDDIVNPWLCCQRGDGALDRFEDLRR
jgi:hypothetical protein